MLRQLLRKPAIRVALAVIVVASAAGLAVFQPWKLWVDKTVNEATPAATAGVTRAPAADVLLASGTFISHEHQTSGKLSILDVGNGRRVLRIEDLNTSNGPDLRVWITDAEVQPGASGWTIFDDSKYTELGDLKGNKGSQNYEIPASLNLADYTSVSIWCARFHVSFGAAKLVPEKKQLSS